MDGSQHKRPVWIGVLLATLAPWMCMLVMGLAAASETDGLADFAAFAALTFVFAFPISLIAMLAVGLPYVLWLRSRGWLTSLCVCAGAALIGALAFVCFVFLDAGGERAPGLSGYLFGAGLGLASGIAFCLGTGPDRAFRPKPLRDLA